MGGTLRDLKDYIESKGGIVVAVSTLSASAGGTMLRVTDEQIAALERLGVTNEQLQQLGIADNIYGLTQSEARQLAILADRGRGKGDARGRKTRPSDTGQVSSGAEGRQAEVTVSDFTDQTSDDTDTGANGTGGVVASVADEVGYSPLMDDSLTEEAADEMAEIMRKSKADGTYMKAPNGAASNLDERQWLQVRTKAFKEWFGDWENDPENASRVVDENGEPKVVYRGSLNADSYSFRSRYQTGAVWFTDSRVVAEHYARENATEELSDDELSSRVKPVFLNLREVSEHDSGGKTWGESQSEPVYIVENESDGTNMFFRSRESADMFTDTPWRVRNCISGTAWLRSQRPRPHFCSLFLVPWLSEIKAVDDKFEEIRVAVVACSGVMYVEAVNGCQIVGRQLKVEYVKVLLHPLSVCAFRYCDYAILIKPPQCHLRSGFAMPFPYSFEDGVLDDVFHAALAPKRCPRHHAAVKFVKQWFYAFLLNRSVTL